MQGRLQEPPPLFVPSAAKLNSSTNAYLFNIIAPHIGFTACAISTVSPTFHIASLVVFADG